MAKIPIIRELRDLGIGTDLVARELDLSPSTVAFYMPGKKELPVKHIPGLMRVLDTAIMSWRQIIKEFRSKPMQKDWKMRINRFEELVDHAEEQLQLYQHVWETGSEA